MIRTETSKEVDVYDLLKDEWSKGKSFAVKRIDFNHWSRIVTFLISLYLGPDLPEKIYGGRMIWTEPKVAKLS